MQEQTQKQAGNELAKILYYYGLIYDSNKLQDKIICPFHKDINPSMQIDYDNGYCYCYCCGESFDGTNMIAGIEKVNLLKASILYQKILKSNKVKKIDLSGRYKIKTESKQALDEASDYYYGLSKIDWLKNGGMPEIEESKNYMFNRGFKAATLKHCEAKITYNYNYPIIFPMLDNGEFKGWVCRTTNKEIEKKRKYLYNEGFTRSNTVVGKYGDKKYVIIVEGYMDRIKMLQNLNELRLHENVVAILGWKISEQQIKKLKDKDINIVISALDNDECGKKGTEYLKKHFEVIPFRYLKGIKDPGEMAVSQFEKMYNKTMKSAHSSLSGRAQSSTNQRVLP